MKIAYVLPMTQVCGGIIAPFYQANELLARGHDVTIFAPGSDQVTWFPLHASLKSLPAPKQGLLPGYDIVIFVGNTFHYDRSFSAAQKFLLLQGKDHLLVSDRERAALLTAYQDPQFHILAVSSWLADFLHGECNGTRVTVIGNGVDLTKFYPEPRPREGFRILIEGNFPNVNKNVIDALEIAGRIRQHHKVEVWALGKRFLSPGSLVDRIFQDPPHDAIPSLYQQCDLLLKTSILEGFGLPQLEAMACGCVPATYASGGVMDFCRHGVNSLVTGVGNLPVLLCHVLGFFGDPVLRRRLKENAISTARSMSWGKVADRLEMVFRESGENPL